MFLTKLLKLIILIKSVQMQGCTVNLFDSWSPIIFAANTFDTIYPLPEQTNGYVDRNITIPVEASIIISCHGGHFSDNFKNTHTLLATCNQNSEFEIQDKIVAFESIDCVNFNPQVVKITSESCGPNAILIEIGFQIGIDIKFIPQLNICFDVELSTTLYSNSNLTKSIGFIKSYLVTPYILDSVFNVQFDFETFYRNVSYQQELFNNQLGLPFDSSLYFDASTCHPDPLATTPGFCFSLRPLTDRGDFVYILEQHATYRYINVVPQWSFLDYNLNKLERNVIDYVKNKTIDLVTYSGTYKAATYPHAETQEETEIYFYNDGKTEAIPLPLFFWKLLYDSVALKAVVFLTVNNPHLSEDKIKEFVLCEDISDEFSWLTWEKHNITKGYSYACSYNETKSVIPYLPDLTVTGILN